MPTEEITARFEYERFRFENPSGDVIIGDAWLCNGNGNGSETDHNDDPFGFNDDNDGRSITIKGEADIDELKHGCDYRFLGRWTTYENRRTGQTEKQFHFSSFVASAPLSREGIIGYLIAHGQGCGIAAGRARQLFERFGQQALEVCRQQPERAAAAIKGWDPNSAVLFAERLKDNQRLEAATVEITELLAGRGLPKTTARKAIKKWGNAAADMIRRDPYQLMSFRGCGFKRCDQLWLDLGLPAGRLRRQALCAWYTIAADSQGHTWYPAQFAVSGLARQVPSAEIRPGKALQLAKRLGKINPDRNGAMSVLRERDGSIVEQGGSVFVAEGRKAWCENELAERIVFSKSELARWPSIRKIKGIDDHQREELRKALRGPVAILGGGPGTGKTYTAAALIRRLIGEFGSDAIAIGCPTGKAAVRITEAMRANGVGIQGRTWHSLLGIKQPDEDSGNWGFDHNENNPLPFRVLIGDESSMIDTNLMSSIFRARSAGTLFLLVGDVNQLPPVGHGAPLRDLIAAGLPYGELREIKRNSGGIVEACAAIRDGEPWGAGDNLHLIGNPDQVKSMLGILSTAQGDGCDPVWDCQVVVAVNDKSPLSRKKINQVLQEVLNPNERPKGSPFAVGDKIVNTKNGYFRIVDERDREIFVANGELAKVTHVHEKKIVAKVSNTEEWIVIPRGRMSEDDTGESTSEKTSTGCSWDLGYALSVHKSQGSEWPIVLVMIDDYPGARMICSREWIYTAISRAKHKCYLIGKKSTADRFCRKKAIGDRKTFLRELIQLKRTERMLVEI